ncbi:MAG: hypothetical protein M3345_00775 [Actinomycetota bacterium]|nr:hypothetical protein [Actinomycetota bacterium]
MLQRRKGVGATLAMTLLLAVVAAQPVSAAPTTYTVQIGAGVPRGFTPRVFAPPIDGVPTLKVQRGDTIHTTGGALILLPVGQGPLAWWEQYAQGQDRPYSAFVSDPDADQPGRVAPFKFNLQLFTPTDPSCGTADNPCVYSGSNPDPVAGVLNPGDLEATGGEYYVTIDAAPGEVIWGIQQFGTPNMTTVLKIQVVGDATAATTQAQIDSARATLLSRTRDQAAALNKKLLAGQSKHTDPTTGRTVYDAWSGYDTDVVSLFNMYPKRIVIHKGDVVRWRFDSLQHEAHTVTFPLKKGLELGGNGFMLSCDPDGDGGPGPDTPGDFQTFSCPDPTQMEFELSARFLTPAGDGRYPGGANTAGKLEHSGMRGAIWPTPGSLGDKASYSLRFTKVSVTAARPNKGYRYICALHGTDMVGKVIVKP